MFQINIVIEFADICCNSKEFDKLAVSSGVNDMMEAIFWGCMDSE